MGCAPFAERKAVPTGSTASVCASTYGVRTRRTLMLPVGAPVSPSSRRVRSSRS
jgi:hypothetical protein